MNLEDPPKKLELSGRVSPEGLEARTGSQVPKEVTREFSSKAFECLEREIALKTEVVNRLEEENRHFRCLLNQQNQQKSALSLRSETSGTTPVTTPGTTPKTTPQTTDSELKRLRERLLVVENEYTEEVVALQNRCHELEQRLAEREAEAGRRATSEGAAFERIRALQTESAQKSHQMSLMEDRLERGAASLRNLQLVVEQIQREHERKVMNERVKYEKQLSEVLKEVSELKQVLKQKETEIKEQEEALAAAQRLLEVLELKERHLEAQKRSNDVPHDGTTDDAKDDAIDDTFCLVIGLETEVTRLEAEVRRARERETEMVEKALIKSVLVQLLSAPEDRKPEIQRLLARILDFNETEMKRTGTQLSFKGKESKENSESFYKSFVEFLEKESKKPEIKDQKEVKDVTRDFARALIESHARSNPFLASRSASQQSLAELGSRDQLSTTNQSQANQLLSFMDESESQTSFVVIPSTHN